MSRRWTDEELTEAVKESSSIAQVLRKLGLLEFGGNYKTIKFHMQKLQLDGQHFKGQAWSKDQLLKTFGAYRTTSASKRLLISERGHQCEGCKNVEWLAKPIALEVDHIDGNNKDNRKENLRLLCPNCHAQTPTYRRKK